MVGPEAEEGEADDDAEDSDGHDDVVVHEHVLHALHVRDGLRLARFLRAQGGGVRRSLASVAA